MSERLIQIILKRKPFKEIDPQFERGLYKQLLTEYDYKFSFSIFSRDKRIKWMVMGSVIVPVILAGVLIVPSVLSTSSGITEVQSINTETAFLLEEIDQYLNTYTENYSFENDFTFLLSSSE